MDKNRDNSIILLKRCTCTDAQNGMWLLAAYASWQHTYTKGLDRLTNQELIKLCQRKTNIFYFNCQTHGGNDGLVP
jgi:hypothetical protein